MIAVYGVETFPVEGYEISYTNLVDRSGEISVDHYSVEYLLAS